MDLTPIRHPHLLRFQPGDRVGRLTVIEALGSKHFGKGVSVVFSCQCECGRLIERDRQSLVRKGHHSCGCDQKHGATAPPGASGHPLYKCWAGMHDRCNSPKSKSFKDYGGRGIKVCDRWTTGEGDLTGFECFVADMGDRPEGRTIERSNSDGHYQPGNCSWATRTTQSRNRRSLRLLTFNSRTHPASAWAEEVGLPYFTLMRRLGLGWTVERALSTPVLQKWDRHPAK